MLASIFGAGLSLDIYYAAFRIPDIVFADEPPEILSVESEKLLANKFAIVSPELLPVTTSSATLASVAEPLATGASLRPVTD